MKRTGDQDNPGHIKRFAPAGFFVLRTPLLPFDDFLECGDGLEAPAALDDPERLAEAIARDRLQLRARIQAIFSRPAAREALFLAAPELEQFFDLWVSDPESERGERIGLALARYFARMSGRATPFGLFAGCSLGNIADGTRLVLKGQTESTRQTRLDMDYLFALVETLRRDPSVANSFVYYPNSSLYRAGGRVRYVEWRLNGKQRTYHLVTVDETDYLAAVLARAAQGATPAQLASTLAGEEVTRAEADAYIADLIENQVLVAGLALPVTGTEPIHSLIEQLSGNEATRQTAERLARTRACLEAIDGSGLGVEPARYRELSRALEPLPVPVELQKLFQVDLVKPAPEATLGRDVLDEIARGIDTLHRLFGGRPHPGDLARFCDAFRERYEGREVPLLEALDDEIGIGFPPDGGGGEAAPLLQGMALPGIPAATADWSAREDLLLGMLCQASACRADEVALQPAELEAVRFKEPSPLPDAFAVMATVAARDQAGLARGDFRVLIQGSSGPSGARLLGRFCHADAALDRQVRQHLQAEEASRPEAVFAEVVHLPEGRLGNVLQRPLLRDYEIAYLGSSGAPADRRIPVTDLLISLDEGRIRLRSRRLGREVIPRLTSAHNFHNSPSGVYRLLASLQGQGTAPGLTWNWGALQAAPFLPRVVMGRLVFCLARWRVGKDEIRRLSASQGAARFRAVQEWRTERRLPRWTALADGDNALPIDLDNVLSIDTLLHLIRRRDEALLTELFPGPDQLCARGPEGRYVHELVVPFERQREEPIGRKHKPAPAGVALPPAGTAGRIGESHRPRRFTPGSEWLYAKLYCGAAVADRVLRDVIKPLCRELAGSGAADLWFFIRYADPEPHLRVRFHGPPDRLHLEAFPALQAVVAPLVEDGRIWRVQLDTYEREVERYGGPEGIQLSERLFHADSEAVLRILELLEPGDAGLDERWRLAVRGMDCLLEDFGFGYEGKRDLIEAVRKTFAKEFRVDRQVTGQLSERFRRERHSLEALLDPAQDADSVLWPGIEILRGRSRQWADTVTEMKARGQAGRLSTSLAALVESHLHMHANRLLRSAQRAQEMVIYDFLSRSYESQLARAAARKEPLAMTR